MKTKKIILIIVAVLVVLIAGACVWFFISTSVPSPSNQAGIPASSSSQAIVPNASSSQVNGSLPTNNPSTSSPAPTQGSLASVFAIATSQGTVLVNNFYKNAAQVFSDGSGALIIRDPAYDILYFQPDGSFTISILKKPVLAVRAQAQEAFLQELGVSQADACKLKVLVGVPISVDSQYSGRDLGLSFCQ